MDPTGTGRRPGPFCQRAFFWRKAFFKVALIAKRRFAKGGLSRM